MSHKYRKKFNSAVKKNTVLFIMIALVLGIFAGCKDANNSMDTMTDHETTSGIEISSGYEESSSGDEDESSIVDSTTSSSDISSELSTEPTEPAETTEPVTEEPTKPSEEATTEPPTKHQEPTTEATTEPPTTETPTEPPTKRPEPTTEAPTEPPTKRPEPAEPSTEAPTEPPTKPPVVDYNVDIRQPVASGTAVSDMNGYVIDYSNMQDGYVMIKSTTSANVVVQIYLDSKSGTLIGQYVMKENNVYMAFPLTKGANTYCVRVLEQKSTGGYVQKNAITQYAAISPETKAYIQPNMYVAYNLNSAAVKLSCELSADKKNNEEKVKAIYEYIVKNVDYDYDYAKMVAANGMVGYMDSERCLRNKKGICGDYAVLFATMCRVQGIPCMVVEGYVTTSKQEFHAWNKVYLNGTWKFYDTTFDASGAKGKNYIDVYFY